MSPIPASFLGVCALVRLVAHSQAFPPFRSFCRTCDMSAGLPQYFEPLGGCHFCSGLRNAHPRFFFSSPAAMRNELLQIFILVADVYLMGSECCRPFDHLTSKVGTMSVSFPALLLRTYFVHAVVVLRRGDRRIRWACTAAIRSRVVIAFP